MEERSLRPHSTLLDAWSRSLLRCEAVLDPDGVAVERILDSAFQEFGLPVAPSKSSSQLLPGTRVENDGGIRWHRRKLHITNALIGDSLELGVASVEEHSRRPASEPRRQSGAAGAARGERHRT